MEQAIAEVLAAHGGRLLDIARRSRWGCDADAMDYVQETLVRFFLRFRDAPPEEPRRGAWLVKTLKNLLISDLRKRRCHLRLLSTHGAWLATAPDEADPMEAVLDAVTEGSLRCAVATLSPNLRETYELHEQGMRSDEIARRQGIRAVTAGKRLHDARRNLRAILERELPPEDCRLLRARARLRRAHRSVRLPRGPRPPAGAPARAA